MSAPSSTPTARPPGSSPDDDVRKQALRFLAVGLGTMALDYLCYRAALGLGLDLAVAKALGFLVGTTATYLVNRAWTFAARGGSGAVASFVVLYSFTLVLNVAANSALFALLDGVAYRVEAAFLVAQAVTSAVNFVGLRYFVFRR